MAFGVGVGRGSADKELINWSLSFADELNYTWSSSKLSQAGGIKLMVRAQII